ncbi:MAG: 30S ribosomal protein S3 [Patescibacteria group bacterium]
MGQKINPNSFRIGVTKKWPVRWFVKANAPQILEEDEAIRKTIYEKILQSGIADIEIERTSTKTSVNIKAARPGFIIGRGGKGIEDLNKLVQKRVAAVTGKKKNTPIYINIEELKRSEVSAAYVGQQIAWDIERRMPFRRLMKKYLDQIMQAQDVKGAKILMGGRLGGAEIARREWLKRGQLPLQTLRAVIDYGQATAYTTYGTIGIKVWIYKGNVAVEKSRDGKNKTGRN